MSKVLMGYKTLGEALAEGYHRVTEFTEEELGEISVFFNPSKLMTRTTTYLCCFLLGYAVATPNLRIFTRYTCCGYLLLSKTQTPTATSAPTGIGDSGTFLFGGCGFIATYS
jgi:Ser/Thr protein kinase RdoA (MazF antagonist)